MHQEEMMHKYRIIRKVNGLIRDHKPDFIQVPGVSVSEMCKSLESRTVLTLLRKTMRSFTLASAWREGSFGAIRASADPVEKEPRSKMPKPSLKRPAVPPSLGKATATIAPSAKRTDNHPFVLLVANCARSSSRNFQKA